MFSSTRFRCSVSNGARRIELIADPLRYESVLRHRSRFRANSRELAEARNSVLGVGLRFVFSPFVEEFFFAWRSIEQARSNAPVRFALARRCDCSSRVSLFAAEDTMSGSAQTERKFPPSSRIQVKPAAGPRLAGRTGTVIGAGYYPKSLRVILDGSKGPITLHMDYVAMINT